MNKPYMKARSGQISLTVWKNNRKVEDKEVESFSFNIEKNVKVGDEWKTFNSFNETDLLKIGSLINKVYDSLCIKVQEFNEDE